MLERHFLMVLVEYSCYIGLKNLTYIEYYLCSLICADIVVTHCSKAGPGYLGLSFERFGKLEISDLGSRYDVTTSRPRCKNACSVEPLALDLHDALDEVPGTV